MAVLASISYGKMEDWQDSPMPKKKKLKRFSAVKVVKEMARERIGAVPRPRVLGNQKKKKAMEQRKPTLEQLLGEE